MPEGLPGDSSKVTDVTNSEGKIQTQVCGLQVNIIEPPFTVGLAYAGSKATE